MTAPSRGLVTRDRLALTFFVMRLGPLDHDSDSTTLAPHSRGAARPMSNPAAPPTFDPLSDVLHAVRLTGAVFFDFNATSPFAAEAPPASEIAPHVMRGAEHTIEFHVIVEGACWGGIVG